jgi:hypothetical protein
MLDLTSALLVGGALFTIVQLLKKAIPMLNGWPVIVVTLVLAYLVTAIVAHSTLGADQVVNGIPITRLNWADQGLVALQLAGISVFGAEVLMAGKNIGENNQTPL